MSHSDIGKEIRNASADPWLPIESKLVGWSLATGIVLLIVLGVANHLFPATL